ncbi:MAG TPA: alpha/beta hydrolase [Bradyrhizobium sp.]|uniref:alpha/beta fold hydrolase n=1 Tax=Bradyrhizobium sp. TaxID=376 RepID=UPI002B4969CC|nr:alpha/beta hydrolase [Bradyrhizobium sp.]HKO73428.1 alpha/beta hydrolase [Bradyrhizobium sp.]
MQTLNVNGYDMAYLEVGKGPPLVCVHGTLGDFRTWSAVLGPLSRARRVIAVSLRHFFPERWDGVGDDYLMAQHVADVIEFIDRLNLGPVDLMGHSRGGHIAFRVAEQRPELLRKLILAEPGGELDPSLDPHANSAPSPRAMRFVGAAEKIRNGDIEGGVAAFFDVIEGDGAWKRLPAAPKQQLRDNAFTLLGQMGENRQPYKRFEAESIKTPTLFVGGAATQGTLPEVLRALAAHVAGAKTAMIAGAGHWMFEQAPQEFCRIVLEFLDAN